MKSVAEFLRSFKVFRPVNLFIIFFTQILIVWNLAIPGRLLWVHFPQWAIAGFVTMLCAAAGYLFNDRLDADTDEINRPGTNLAAAWSEKAFWVVYLLLNLLALALAYLISTDTAKITLGIIALLFFYNVQLKKLPVAGNLLVALLSALAVVFPVFTGIPIHKTELALYGAFAFWVSFLREMAKDAEDREGDQFQGRTSVATWLSTFQFNLVLAFLHLILFAGYAWVISAYEKSIWWWYWALGLQSASMAILIFIFYCNRQEQYRRLSFLYKLLMLAGICSLFFWN